MNHAAIMVHYGEVTEMEQRVLMDVGCRALAVITPVYRVECVRQTLPTKWPRSSNMAAVARSK